MNRQLIVAGLVGFGLVLFVFIVGGTAAPWNAPLMATEDPNDDNNDFTTADPVPVPGYVTGALSQTGSTIYDSQDYFVLTTTIGSSYEAVLGIQYSQAGMGAEMTLYRGTVYKESGPGSSMAWTAVTTTYYIRVDSTPAMTSTPQLVQYRVNIDQIPPTSVPTDPPPTALPTAVSNADAYETYGSFTDNNEPGHAYVFPVTTYLKLSSYLGIATFHDVTDGKKEEGDWYAFWCKDDKWYQITTSELSGVDTRVVIKDEGNSWITSNDDGGGGLASLASFEASYDGYYYIHVHNMVDATGSYNMTVEEIGDPEPGATNTPGPGPDSEADPCEDNLDFAHACVIAPNNPKKFNFVPPYGGVDNDFFKLWIKPGYNYECFTDNLDAGVDPNMIVFNGPSWDNALGGNDDVEPGDLNSYFAVYATYEGWLYVLVGYGDRTPSDVYNSNYTLECTMSTPGEPTATPTRPATGTPRPTSPSPPTATPYAGLTIRQLTTPTPVPETPLEPGFVLVNLIVYYDANGDGQPGAGEGVAGISAQAYEISTNNLLAQGVTDEQGHLEFTVTAQGPVRVSVPFFGFVQIVAGEEAIIRLRVPSRPLPGGGP